MRTAALDIAPCPSCSDDGDYGTTRPGQHYRCPECRVVWSPRPEGAPVTTRIGTVIQRVKIALTTQRTPTRQENR